MKSENNCTCEICGRVCNIKNARLEWVKERTSPYQVIRMHLCHKECAMGYKDPRAFVSDIDLNSYTKEELCERLNTMKKEWPYIKEKIDYIQYLISKEA